MADPVVVARSPLLALSLVGALALGCASKQVPIGEQTDAGRGAGTGGAATAGAGAGGSAGPGGATGSGGASGGPDAGAAGGAGGTDAAAGGVSGSDAGSGGTSGSDAATSLDGGSCPVTFTSALTKSCTTASDCTLVRHDDCCGGVITAIRVGSDTSFASAEQAYQTCVPGCGVRGCFHADMAEDGQTLAGAGRAFAAACQGGRCTSVVTVGSSCASDGDCGSGQICVAFATNLGPSSTTTLSCRGNPCGASALACTCAGSICTGFLAGLCSVNNGRLTCDDGRQ